MGKVYCIFPITLGWSHSRKHSQRLSSGIYCHAWRWCAIDHLRVDGCLAHRGMQLWSQSSRKMDSIKPMWRTSGRYPTWHLHRSWWNDWSACSWRNFWSGITFFRSFRKRHSTETALLKVMSDILLAADKGHATLLGLLDMSAEFDTVDHDISVQW